MIGSEPTRKDAGRGLWRTVLSANVVSLSIVSLLNDASSEMIYPLLPSFLVGTLGASAASLGLIEGVAESTSSFVKLAGGYISDRVRRRTPLVVIGYTIAALARPLMAVATAVWHVLAIRFTDRIGKGLRTAPRDALLAESVPPALRGRAFGVHRAADHLGAVIGPLLGSLMLIAVAGRVRLVFALALIPGLLCVLILLLGVRERSAARAPTEHTSDVGDDVAPDVTSAKPSLRGPLAPFFAVLLVFALGNATDAFLLLRAEQLGVPIAALPLLWAVHHLSKMAWSVPGGALADRFGARRTIVAGWFIYALTYAGFAVAQTSWHAWLLFVLYGVFYGLTEAPEKALVAQLAPAGRRGGAFGAYHFVIGMAALPASLLFGIIWQRSSAANAFLFGAALALTAAALLVIVPLERTTD